MLTYQLQTEKNAEFLYRYDVVNSLDALFLQLHMFPIIKRTLKGAQIDVWGRKKFVLLSGRKRFAWPTKEEALFSFQKRKEAQIRILKNQLETAEEGLRLSKCDSEIIDGQNRYQQIVP